MRVLSLKAAAQIRDVNFHQNQYFLLYTTNYVNKLCLFINLCVTVIQVDIPDISTATLT